MVLEQPDIHLKKGGEKKKKETEQNHDLRWKDNLLF